MSRFRILTIASAICIFTVSSFAAEPPSFVGKFAGEGLKVDLKRASADSADYTGTIDMSEKHFPLKGSFDNAKGFNGSFSSDGTDYDFALTLKGNEMLLETSGTTYHLKRADDANPLAKKKPAEEGKDNPLAKKEAKPGGDAAKKDAADLDRPALVVTQGQYFRWAAPKGWTANETTNGVDLLSPDKTMGASSALVVASINPTPRQWMEYTMKMTNIKPTKVIEVKDLPDQPLGNGAVYKMAMQEQLVEYGGVTFHQVWISAVVPGGGASNMIVSASEDKWEKAKLWLPIVAQSVAMTKRGFALPSLPQNNPMDHDLLMKSWREKGLSEDRISQAQRESTMGYERMKDPETGTMYNMPLETYDGTRGGYVNPERPDELLKKADTGE